MLSNYFKQFLVSIIREIIQTILTNYYHRNHSKQFLQAITKEVVPNSSYKLIPEVIPNNAFKLFQTILSIYYQRNHSKQFLQTIITETISNNSCKLLPMKSLQKMSSHYDKHYKLCLKTINRKLEFIL